MPPLGWVVYRPPVGFANQQGVDDREGVRRYEAPASAASRIADAAIRGSLTERILVVARERRLGATMVGARDVLAGVRHLSPGKMQSICATRADCVARSKRPT